MSLRRLLIARACMGTFSRAGAFALTGALVAAALLSAVVALMPAPAAAAPALAEHVHFRAADGTMLYGYVYGAAPLKARPVIFEASTYAPTYSANAPLIAGPAYNYLELQVRGTGRSSGVWNVFGAADQADIHDFAQWSCGQPWSDGKLALTGFSSPAISAYTAMRRHISCLRTAVLLSGTASLYRDVAWIGGIPQVGIGSAFVGLVANPFATNLPNRAQDDPGSIPTAVAGYPQAAASFFGNPQENRFWTERDFLHPVDRPSVPILSVSGFYDIESQGAQEAYWATRRLGSQLAMIGGHEGTPAARAYFSSLSQAWFDHYLRGIDNGIDRGPHVHVWEPIGGLPAYQANQVIKFNTTAWPIAGTRYETAYLHGGRSGSAQSINDGTLNGDPPSSPEPPDAYPFAPSNSAATDPNLLPVAGIKPPLLSGDLRTAARDSLTYTTSPLTRPPRPRRSRRDGPLRVGHGARDRLPRGPRRRQP